MLDMFSLEGKTAIVTGGNRGLGNGMAHALCEAGAEIVIFASSDSVFDAAKALQEEGYKASGMKVDLSNRAEVEKVFAS
ncbi:MAG: SDR family NAD(P)-dependent oxidoreductase, partial [Oscillospiraceae bacterium]